MILLIMAPSFHKQVEPQLPGGLKAPYYYLVPYAHALLGAIAEVLGVYIVMVASTNLIPNKLRFKRYKPWMRTELTLWWLVVLIGVCVYYVWYIGTGPKSTPATASAPAQSAVERLSVKISNFQFEPKELTVKAGTIVQWTDERGRHTVQADDGSFSCDTLTAGGQFEHRFDVPGVYPYYCAFHGDRHGADMAGVITVTARGH